MRRGCQPRCATNARTCWSTSIGLCVAARNQDYVKAALDGWDDDGPCTAIGHARTLSRAGAAFVNGTAAHGEDFDDTFEGGPVHAGAVIVPAVLAACERHNRSMARRAAGIAVGVESLCRLSLVIPKRCTRPASTRPRCSAPWGPRPASAPRSKLDRAAARRCARHRRQHGVRHHRISRRRHVDQAHASGLGGAVGLRAALLARAGFVGPRTVFEGTHGFFHGFAHTHDGDYAALTGGFGERWVTETLAFKPYPCGTMTHPYIDCARRLQRAASGRTTSRRSSARSAKAPCTAYGSRSPTSSGRPTATRRSSACPTASRPRFCTATSAWAVHR